MPLDHVSVGVTDMRKAQALYDPMLAPLGVKPVYPVDIGGMLVAIGYGEAADKAVFWIQLPINRQPASMGNGVHIAFQAPTRAAVDAFYLAALANGAIDDGGPGLRTEYHPNYYAAFIRDADGNKIEAVCHAPA